MAAHWSVVGSAGLPPGPGLLSAHRDMNKKPCDLHRKAFSLFPDSISGFFAWKKYFAWLFTAAALSGFSLAATSDSAFESGYSTASAFETGLDGALCFSRDTSRDSFCGSFFGAANFFCRASH